MKIISAPIGGFIGAILGGVLWAKYIQWTGYTGGIPAIGIGVLTAFGILLTGNMALKDVSKNQLLLLAIGSAIFSIIGIFVGKYLDVRWNALSSMIEQILANEPLLSEEAAVSIAESQYSNFTKWELMKDRMEWFDLIFGSIAILVAFYVTYNPWVRKLAFKFR